MQTALGQKPKRTKSQLELYNYVHAVTHSHRLVKKNVKCLCKILIEMLGDLIKVNNVRR